MLEKYPMGTFYGKSHSDDSKCKMRESHRINNHQQGIKNSQYGTMWITDGTQNVKIKNTEPIPDGWSKGRKIK